MRERRASVTVIRSDSGSPGRTGASQRSSSMPGEAHPGRAWQEVIDQQPHHQARRVPAARDHAAERACGREPRVDVEWLRIELAAEGNDLGLVDLDRTVVDDQS